MPPCYCQLDACVIITMIGSVFQFHALIFSWWVETSKNQEYSTNVRCSFVLCLLILLFVWAGLHICPDNVVVPYISRCPPVRGLSTVTPYKVDREYCKSQREQNCTTANQDSSQCVMAPPGIPMVVPMVHHRMYMCWRLSGGVLREPSTNIVKPNTNVARPQNGNVCKVTTCGGFYRGRVSKLSVVEDLNVAVPSRDCFANFGEQGIDRPIVLGWSPDQVGSPTLRVHSTLDSAIGHLLRDRGSVLRCTVAILLELHRVRVRWGFALPKSNIGIELTLQLHIVTLNSWRWGAGLRTLQCERRDAGQHRKEVHVDLVDHWRENGPAAKERK